MKWWQSIRISFFNAGLVSVWDEDWALHFIVFPHFWLFGKIMLKHRAFNKVHAFGLGPLFLFCLTKRK